MAVLASMQHGLNRHDEALKAKTEVLRMPKEIFSLKHPSTIVAMGNLALTLHRQKKFEKADQLMSQAVDLSEETEGAEHPTTIHAKKT